MDGCKFWGGEDFFAAKPSKSFFITPFIHGIPTWKSFKMHSVPISKYTHFTDGKEWCLQTNMAEELPNQCKQHLHNDSDKFPLCFGPSSRREVRFCGKCDVHEKLLAAEQFVWCFPFWGVPQVQCGFSSLQRFPVFASVQFQVRTWMKRNVLREVSTQDKDNTCNPWRLACPKLLWRFVHAMCFCWKFSTILTLPFFAHLIQRTRLYVRLGVSCACYGFRLIAMRESGLLVKWWRKHWPDDTCQDSVRTVRSPKTKLVETTGAYFVLGLGLGVSIIVFLVEAFMGRLKQKKQLWTRWHQRNPTETSVSAPEKVMSNNAHVIFNTWPLWSPNCRNKTSTRDSFDSLGCFICFSPCAHCCYCLCCIPEHPHQLSLVQLCVAHFCVGGVFNWGIYSK